MAMHERYMRLTKAEGIVTVSGIGDIGNAGVHSLFSIEGGGGLFADSPELETLHKSGLRVLGLAWDKNELAASSNEQGSCDYGLTEKGRLLVQKCNEMKIIIDISHLSDRGFWDLCDVEGARIVATHSNFRRICNHGRNLTDGMALALKHRGGVIGISLYPPHLKESGEADIWDILRHIDYGLSLLGEDCVALGLDIDGTGGRYPNGLGEGERIHEKIVNALLSEYSEKVVRKIAGENALSFLASNL